jgi:hypothetical protein
MSNEIRSAAHVLADRQTADVNNRTAFGCLPHQQRSGGRQFIGKADLRGPQLAAASVRQPAQISKRRQAGNADRGPDGPQTPGATETVVDYNTNIRVSERPYLPSQIRRRTIRVFWQ